MLGHCCSGVRLAAPSARSEGPLRAETCSIQSPRRTARLAHRRDERRCAISLSSFSGIADLEAYREFYCRRSHLSWFEQRGEWNQLYWSELQRIYGVSTG